MKTTKRSFFIWILENLQELILTKTAPADCNPMYQQNKANSNFEKFSNMFENILNNIAPTKIKEPSSKSTKKDIVIQKKFESY